MYYTEFKSRIPTLLPKPAIANVFLITRGNKRVNASLDSCLPSEFWFSQMSRRLNDDKGDACKGQSGVDGSIDHASQRSSTEDDND